MTENLNVRTRIALASAAQQAADRCRAVVGDVAIDLDAGDRIKKARLIRKASLQVVDLAVLAELADGRTWDQVAQALAMDESDARAKYEPVWNSWLAGDYDGTVLPEFSTAEQVGSDLAGAAAYLDSWWERHAEPWDTLSSAPAAQVLVDGQRAARDR